MFKNYFKIAWRNIIRNKTHTIINVAGLAPGLTCCIFIYLWVQDEKSIDNFRADKKNLYVIYTTTAANGKTDGAYTTPIKFSQNAPPEFLLENASNAIPEIKHITFYATGYELPWGHPETFQSGEKVIKMEGSRAGKDFFKMFTYPLVEGNAESALSNMNGIAISRKMAEIFFGSPANAIGKSLRYENKLNFIVTAVFENLPEQSSLHFDFLFNMDAQKNLLEWASNNLTSYVELADNADPKKVEAEMNAYLQPRLDKQGKTKITTGLQLLGEQYL
jgi:hypothetical protein